jgi:excisionase family DNA binding protein
MAIHQEPNAFRLPVEVRAHRASKLGASSADRSVRPAHLGAMDINELGLEPLIGVEELAAYLGVPIQTIYDWRCAGTAPRAFKFGKRLKFAVSDVAAWIEDHQEDARTEEVRRG